MNESDIQAFWQDNPCGDFLVGGLEKYKKDFETFFSDYDNFRYRTHSHLLRCLNAINFRDRKTLEIGLGQGADAEQIIRRDATWSGVDLISESVQGMKARLYIEELAISGSEARQRPHPTISR